MILTIHISNYGSRATLPSNQGRTDGFLSTIMMPAA
jgi:hypothetical protein